MTRREKVLTLTADGDIVSVGENIEGPKRFESSEIHCPLISTPSFRLRVQIAQGIQGSFISGKLRGRLDPLRNDQ
jgi:hypothetical protein